MLSRRAGLGASSSLIRTLSGTAHGFRPSLRRDTPAHILLLHARYLATETSTSSGGSTYPPPGFNANTAQKSIPTDSAGKPEGTARVADGTDMSHYSDALKKQVKIPGNLPTSDPKTHASEIQTLTELAAEKASSDKAEAAKSTDKRKEEKKLTVWQKVKKEANHYWDGTKLLVTEVRISSKLALKMAAGYELTRREHRQVRHRLRNYSSMLTIFCSCTVLSKTWADSYHFPFS